MSKKFNIHDWQAKQKLVEAKGHKISQEEMEKLHKDGKIKLKDGSMLFFVKEEDMDEVSTTSTGASFNAGAGEGYATPKAFGDNKNKKKKAYMGYKEI